MPRLGFIVPTTHTVNEGEWQRMAPAGVTLALVRMVLHTDSEALYADLAKAMDELASHEPDVMEKLTISCKSGPALPARHGPGAGARLPRARIDAPRPVFLTWCFSRRSTSASPLPDRTYSH